MKYIRTGDKILEVKFNKKREYWYFLEPICEGWVNEIKINIQDYKQADTIEELCDEFVILPLNQNKKVISHFLRTPKIDDIGHFLNDSHIIYGAIWTDKGLIYVAKMNDKGTLELL